MKRELWLIDSQRQLVHLAENGGREPLGVAVGSEDVESLESLFRHRLKGLASVGIVLDSTGCFWEAISQGGKGRGETKFELEEMIPFDAEDLHFVVDTDHFPGFGVATELAPLRALVEVLQRSDVEVEFVIPQALAEWQLARPAWGASDSVFICQADERFDVLLQRGGKLVGWSLAWDLDQLVQRCRTLGSESLAIWASVENAVGDNLQLEFGQQVTLVKESVKSLSNIWSGKRGGWLGNLAIGPLESRKVKEGLASAMQVALLMTLLSLVTLAGSTYYRATMDREAAAGLRDGQQRRLLRLHPELPRRRYEEWFASEIAAKQAILDAVRGVVDRQSLLTSELPVGLRATAALVPDHGRSTRLEVMPNRVQLSGEFANVRPAEEVFDAEGWDVSPQPLVGGAKVKTVEARRGIERPGVAGRRFVGARQ